MKKSTLFFLTMMAWALSISAMETPTADRGERLFGDSSLGTTGNSCLSCHPNGSRLEESKAYDDGMLKEMVNFCIRDAMKGEMLPPDSIELNSFLLYLRSLE